MKRVLVLVGMALCCSTSLFSEILVLNDGTEIEVETYAIKGKVIVFTNMEGRARSVALSFVDLDATEEQNRLPPEPPDIEKVPSPGPPDIKKIPSPRPHRITPLVRVAKKMSPVNSAEGFQEAPAPKPRRVTPLVREEKKVSAVNSAEGFQEVPSPKPRRATPLVREAKKMSPVDDSAEGFQEVLDVSGIKGIVSQIPSLVSGGLSEARQQGLGKGLGTSELVQQAFDRAFRPDRIYPIVTESFAGRTEDRQFGQALAWLRSPLARRMAEMEQSAKSPEGLRALPEFAADLGQNMPPAARLEALQRLDDLTGMTEGALDRRMRVTRAVLEVHCRIGPEESRLTEQEMVRAIQKARSKIEVSMKNYALMNMLFTYRMASDEELADYIAFWEGETGRWLSGATRESLSAGIDHGIETVMESIALEAQNVAWRR